jgi:hypothetical protein
VVIGSQQDALADEAPQQLLRCPAAARVAASPYFSRTLAFNWLLMAPALLEPKIFA